MFDYRGGCSQRKASKKFNCSQQYISKQSNLRQEFVYIKKSESQNEQIVKKIRYAVIDYTENLNLNHA